MLQPSECALYVATVQATAVRQLTDVLRDVLHDVSECVGCVT